MDVGQQNLRADDQKLGAEQVHILPGQADCHRFNDPGGWLFCLFRSGYRSAEGFWWSVHHARSANRQYYQNLPGFVDTLLPVNQEAAMLPTGFC